MKGAKKVAKKMPVKGEKKIKKHTRRETYKAYILRVLKQVHSEIGISAKAMEIMNSFMVDTFDKLCLEAHKLCKYTRKDTLSSAEMRTSVKLCLPGELSKHADAEGTKALSKYTGTA